MNSNYLIQCFCAVWTFFIYINNNNFRERVNEKYLLLLIFVSSFVNADFKKGFACYEVKDYACALTEWKISADQGDAGAQNNLGRMYVGGQGVIQNTQKAKKWLGKACDGGSQKGCDGYRILNEAGY